MYESNGSEIGLALDDVVIVTPAAKVAERMAEYPGMKVRPISFKSSELEEQRRPP
jgi:hypothetical protein